MSLLKQVKTAPENAPLRVLLYGVEGIGKSTWGAAWPKPLFLGAEDGLVGALATTHRVQPNDWIQVLALLDEVAESKHEYRSLVIDTVGWLEPLLIAQVCRANNKSGIEKFEFGKGWITAMEEWIVLLSKLEKVRAKGLNIVLLEHARVKATRNPSGADYDRYTTKLADGEQGSKVYCPAGKLREWCDCVLFANWDTVVDDKDGRGKAFGGNKRVVYTAHRATHDAKNRFGLPETLPLDFQTFWDAIHTGQRREELVRQFREMALRVKPGDTLKIETWLRGNPSINTLESEINRLKTATAPAA